jgi:hypothetical protein
VFGKELTISRSFSNARDRTISSPIRFGSTAPAGRYVILPCDVSAT